MFDKIGSGIGSRTKYRNLIKTLSGTKDYFNCLMLVFDMKIATSKKEVAALVIGLNQLIGCQYLSVKFIFLYAILFLGIPNNPPAILWKVFLYVVG